MEEKRTIAIKNEMGDQLIVNLVSDGYREGTSLSIDGKFYHFERISRIELMTDYRVDTDPDFCPQADASGYCYILAPFAE